MGADWRRIDQMTLTHQEIASAQAIKELAASPLALMRRLYAAHSAATMSTTLGGRRVLLAVSQQALEDLLLTSSPCFRTPLGPYTPLFGGSSLADVGPIWAAKRAAARAAMAPGSEGAMLDRAGPAFTAIDRALDAAARDGEPIDLDTLFADAFIDAALLGLAAREVDGFEAARYLEQAIAALDAELFALDPMARLLQHFSRNDGREAAAGWRALAARLADAPRTRATGADGVLRASYLDALLAAGDDASSPFCAPEAVAAEIALSLAFGARAAAAAALAAVALIAANPETAEAVGDEVARAASPGANATLDDLVETRRAVFESLRLRPPIWLLARVALEPVGVGGYEVRPGELVLASPYGAHHCPNLWRSPQRFNPQRFAGEEALRRPRLAFLPFGAGQRACIAAQAATSELTALVALVFGRRRLTLVEPGALDESRFRAGLTLWPKGSIAVRVTLRRRRPHPRREAV